MILSDTAILEAIAQRSIVIDPFDEHCLGGNSYDVHLASTLLVYSKACEIVTPEGFKVAVPLDLDIVDELDAKAEEPVDELEIDELGYILEPGILYLATTTEYTETHKHVPYLDGKSSIGRLGIFIHTTAGRGDVGFCGHWTMEISVVHPVVVYAAMPIGQLTFHTVEGEVKRRYQTKPGAKYTQGEPSAKPRPVPSAMWKNFPKPEQEP